MQPILFSIFGLPFPAWYVFFALAAFGAFFYSHFLLKQSGNRAALASLPQLFILCYLSGWFGARALSIATEQLDVTTFRSFANELANLGPMTFYGGALLSFFLGLIFVLTTKKPAGLLADALIPAGVLALGIGRIGCFLNGDDYGRELPVSLLTPSPPWWSVHFSNLDILTVGGVPVARYPVQLEEAAVCFILATLAAVIFVLHYKHHKLKKLAPGHIACVFAFLSFANRYANEMYRGDARGYFMLTSISLSQGIAIIFMFISVLAASVCAARQTWQYK